MPNIELDYLVPAADLAPYVTVFYRFAAGIPAFDELERSDVAQFRFRLAGSAGDYLYAGESIAASPIHVMAASHAPRRSRCRGPMAVFGMGLTPAGWGALVPPSQRDARVIDEGVLLGASVEALAAAFAGAGDAATMAALAEPVLRHLLGGPDPAMMAFVAAVDGWLAATPSTGLAVRVGATGLSRRPVERRCNTLYGAPPKLLARKVRALRAAPAIATGAAPVDELLAEGFYDQSHLIREMKQFTGRTPRRLRDDPGMLARLTMTRRAALRGQVGPLMSDT